MRLHALGTRDRIAHVAALLIRWSLLLGIAALIDFDELMLSLMAVVTDAAAVHGWTEMFGAPLLAWGVFALLLLLLAASQPWPAATRFAVADGSLSLISRRGKVVASLPLDALAVVRMRPLAMFLRLCLPRIPTRLCSRSRTVSGWLQAQSGTRRVYFVAEDADTLSRFATWRPVSAARPDVARSPLAGLACALLALATAALRPALPVASTLLCLGVLWAASAGVAQLINVPLAMAQPTAQMIDDLIVDRGIVQRTAAGLAASDALLGHVLARVKATDPGQDPQLSAIRLSMLVTALDGIVDASLKNHALDMVIAAGSDGGAFDFYPMSIWRADSMSAPAAVVANRVCPSRALRDAALRAHINLRVHWPSWSGILHGASCADFPEEWLAASLARGPSPVPAGVGVAGERAAGTAIPLPAVFETVQAIAEKKPPRAEWLLNTALALPGVKLDEQDAFGATPLMRAIALGYAPAARQLLARGADPAAADLAGRSVAYYAAVHGFNEFVDDKLIDAERARRTAAGESLLHAAAAGGNAELIGLLIGKGLSANAASSDGRTPLHEVRTPSRSPPALAAVRLLVGAGARPEATDQRGRNAAHYAARRGDLAVLDLLQSLGAPMTARDIYGRDPWSYLPAPADDKQAKKRPKK